MQLYSKNSDKSKYMYSGYGIAFDGAGSWKFGNDFAWIVVIFGVDNSSASHNDNRKNNFLVLGDGPTNDINGSGDAAEQKFSINFTWVCIIMVIMVIYSSRIDI